jgi:hypothetical protein
VITPTTRIDELQGSHAKRSPRPRSRRKSLRLGRTIHLLDIENLTRATRPTTTEVVDVMATYQRLVPIGPLDQFVVAVNHGAFVAVGIALRGAQLLARSGPDGADQALVEAARNDRVDLRFDRVVIGSGDGYFADLAAWLRAGGVQVTVVSRRECLSWRLYTAVPDLIFLELPVLVGPRTALVQPVRPGLPAAPDAGGRAAPSPGRRLPVGRVGARAPIH